MSGSRFKNFSESNNNKYIFISENKILYDKSEKSYKFDANYLILEGDIDMARISDFTNFSSSMSTKGLYPLTLEYFCFEDEEIWTDQQEKIIDKGIKELKKIFDKDFNVVHSAISKNSKAYPVIQTGYEKELQNIREWIEQFDDLVPIGRSGMFKYNNQDHAMATGQLAARNYLGLGEFDVWQVNVDGEYHEEIQNIN